MTSHSRPTVSLGMMVYNGQEHIADEIDSLLNQTFEDFELIIGDNASTDATEKICRDFAAKDRRIRYVRRERNLGAIQNANLVFEEARGEYYKFVAHDDVHAPQYLEKCVAALRENPDAILCHTDTVMIDRQGEPLPQDRATGMFIDWSGRGWALDPPRRLGSPQPHPRYHDILHHTTLVTDFWGLMRRDALLKTMPLGSYFGSDRPLLARLALAGRFHSIPEKPFFLRRHPTHASSQSHKGRAEVVIPAASLKIRMSSAQVYRDFARAIANSDVSATEKFRCFISWLELAASRRTLRKMFIPGKYNFFGIDFSSAR